MLADLGVGDWSGWWLDGFEIDENVGNFLQNPMRDALGLIDDDTYFELLEFHHQRIADVAQYLTSTRDWDLLMTETHASDYTSHFFLSLAERAFRRFAQRPEALPGGRGADLCLDRPDDRPDPQDRRQGHRHLRGIRPHLREPEGSSARRDR